MGLGAALSDEEEGKIKGPYEAGCSEREIGRRVGRSRGAISRSEDVRLLLRTAAKGSYSARQLKSELSLSASVRTIQRVLAGVDWRVYTEMDNTLRGKQSGQHFEIYCWAIVVLCRW
ncbi:hypothetical protein F444_10920 [Phytophthora nicotianae P1976]|uniref:Tc3 transposase DNA binding domain-containing protein n=1 Tax=Phytophthora nicotianae P1976 TaxID=1317066 RepID=A0A081A2K2_PHYNI|nr:hypothetical protein F444_10920 [Phytophthora nicotianae P1976]